MARFQKTAATPANAVRAYQGAVGPAATTAPEEGEAADKAPIVEKANGTSSTADDEFGGFDDDEDAKYMQRAKRNAMRRRGLDPRALDRKTAKGAAKSKAA